MDDRDARFFTHPTVPAHRLYEALRAYLVEKKGAREVGRRFGYTPGTLYVLASKFRAGRLAPFFVRPRPGPKRQPKKDAVRDLAMDLRKKNHSIYDIQRLLSEQGRTISVRAVWEILTEAGFARLPRRLDEERPAWPGPIAAAKADRRAFVLSPVECRTAAGGLFLFLPFLVEMRFDRIVSEAGYPGTKAIPALQYVLSLLALKLIGRERISHVMDVAHDKGVGFFCGLNAIPKTTALTTYSYRIRRSQNLVFLKAWNRALKKTGLVKGESFNLDFHAIAHYGEESVLEKNYCPVHK
jgi:transposase